MNTKEIADQFVAYCRNDEYMKAYDMYAEDAVHVEMPGMPGPQVVEGKQEIINSFHQWMEGIEEHHGGTVGDPVIAGNHFMVPMTSDDTFKGQGRWKMEEMCMYELNKQGQIKKATFFYEVPEGM